MYEFISFQRQACVKYKDTMRISFSLTFYRKMQYDSVTTVSSLAYVIC